MQITLQEDKMTEISQEFLATIKKSLGQMIYVADELNNKPAGTYFVSHLVESPERKIIDALINDAKSILSQMEGFV